MPVPCRRLRPRRSEARCKSALEVLVAANPKVYIQLMSIPDINNLHTIFTNPPDQNALTRWSLFNVCQGLLANPLSTERLMKNDARPSASR